MTVPSTADLLELRCPHPDCAGDGRQSRLLLYAAWGHVEVKCPRCNRLITYYRAPGQPISSTCAAAGPVHQVERRPRSSTEHYRAMMERNRGLDPGLIQRRY